MVEINIYQTKQEMGQAAANKAARIIQQAIKFRNKAYFIAATGVSQFEFLNYLIKHKEIEWEKTEMFHLDEYIGLTENNPASFRFYLKKRIVEKINPGKIYFIKGDAVDHLQECDRISNIIKEKEIDVAFVGIGENGHLAFNDPPADFKSPKPYLIVDLDEKCRIQQVGEGWFKTLEEVPEKAITMSISEIMRVKNIICTCPDRRKALAVRNCLSEGTIVSPNHPASILKKHKRVFCYLDKKSAFLL